MPVHRHPVASAQANGSFTGIPLDKALIARLRSSFAAVRRHELRLGELFYHKLFTVAPHLRPMFRSEPQAQAAKLIAALDAIVSNLENPEANAAMITALGRRHAEYGARPEHYTLVTEFLVESMRELLAPTSQDMDAAHPAQGAEQSLSEVLDEWRTALTLISQQMIAASKSNASADQTDAGPTPERPA